jgi:hypothetical protein
MNQSVNSSANIGHLAVEPDTLCEGATVNFFASGKEVRRGVITSIVELRSASFQGISLTLNSVTDPKGERLPFQLGSNTAVLNLRLVAAADADRTEVA